MSDRGSLFLGSDREWSSSRKKWTCTSLLRDNSSFFKKIVLNRDGQVHIFRELDHSRSLPKKSEPRSLTFMNFYLVKIWATFTHDHSRSWGDHRRNHQSPFSWAEKKCGSKHSVRPHFLRLRRHFLSDIPRNVLQNIYQFYQQFGYLHLNSKYPHFNF